MSDPTNEAVNDPDKVLRHEAEALLMELELARGRVNRLLDANDKLRNSPNPNDLDWRIVVGIGEGYKHLLDDLQWLLDSYKVEDGLRASRPDEPPKMTRA
jgi:hypothetical protein